MSALVSDCLKVDLRSDEYTTDGEAGLYMM